MKAKVLLYVLIIGVLSLGAFSFYKIFFDKSNVYYERAVRLYEDEQYEEAHNMVKRALDINNTHRKALLLKSKLYVIVKGEDDVQLAERLYQEAMNHSLDGELPQAKLKLSKAYDLAVNVSSNSLVKDRARALVEKIKKNAPRILDTNPSAYVKRARRHMDNGDYIRAYEVLSNASNTSQELIKTKSEAAFRIAEKRYRSVMQNPQSAADSVIGDAIFWLNNVDASFRSYDEAVQMKQELQQLR